MYSQASCADFGAEHAATTIGIAGDDADAGGEWVAIGDGVEGVRSADWRGSEKGQIAEGAVFTV